MPKRNKTSDINYRFLASEDFGELFDTNLEAFSDYVVPLQMTNAQFENHLAQNAVDLNLSVGAYHKDRMVGFTLNGFGDWNGKSTCYDAGTGVVPEFRNRGIATTIFEFLLPKIREDGVEQMLLEVIETNQNAFRLYRKLGFEKTRNLIFFEQDGPFEISPNENIKISELEDPDWRALETFWDKNASWQFSSASIVRKTLGKKIMGAFWDEKLVGYGVVYPTSGVISQIAIDKRHRRNGIATVILLELSRSIKKDQKLKLSNVDESLTDVAAFAKSFGFKRTITQFEMIKIL